MLNETNEYRDARAKVPPSTATAMRALN
ncbi:hypothetical protein CGCVW01_v011309 [Colletotrichum viniferum]|nr:hypothetical protein CGCVW01_v011309 [Colletotrichum viniferum]